MDNDDRRQLLNPARAYAARGNKSRATWHSDTTEDNKSRATWHSVTTKDNTSKATWHSDTTRVWCPYYSRTDLVRAHGSEEVGQEWTSQ